VIATRAYWILPNRGQKDDILASDGKTTLPLRRILDPKLRPEGFSHGVPAELLEKCGPKDAGEILFAQKFPDWDGGKQLFSVSTTAGLDASGRVVHLGLLFLLEPNERPRFELPYAGLSEEDRSFASALIRRMASPGPGDSWVQSVRDLVELPPSRGPATNVELRRSTVPFYSLYALGPAGLVSKASSRSKSRVSALILLLFVASLSVWAFMRACERPSRPAVQTGVVICHLN